MNQERFEAERKNVSTESGEGLDNYHARASYIERIYIENVGAIARLELRPSESISPTTPAFALLGNNGVGKSTVLKAIALAMAGEKYAKRLRVSSNDLLAKTAQSGRVRIKTSDGREDIVMSLKRGRRLTFNLDSSRALVLAYGATRLLPRGRHKPKAGMRHAKIDNLFDPFLPVTDVNSWVAGLSGDKLEEANRVLASLLPDGSSLQVIWDEQKGKMLVSHGDESPMDVHDLSDGYKSMVAVAADILYVMNEAGYHSMESAQGIVLIDEMGNHFHPSWRLRTVLALRRAFPYIQFIFTTHDPLCLRGLEQGEVAVLRRDRSGQVYALEDLPAVNRLRVDQLLTSEHFGLQSTVDPMEQQVVERYEELAESPTLSEEEREELRLLTARLTESQYLGSTRRERMMLKLLDMEDVEDAVNSVGTVKAGQLADETVDKLRKVLRAVVPRSDA
ncbi:AAA family ATPase [Ralstonia insidiosa]|uniref:AAA family ATPase n=1 Tax=Ralstonia insidiosa TaxID=190721 RepID=UPI001FC98661|nr:AAA family ATPase [Ralstonia insidiosa]